MLKKVFLLINTIKFLRFNQICYNLVYKIFPQNHNNLYIKNKFLYDKNIQPLFFDRYIDKSKSFMDYTFTFLNKANNYPKNHINWNDCRYGKLWSYYLNYMDYLNQENMDKETGENLINQFIEGLSTNSIGLESYPIAIRGINWIKFSSKHSITDSYYSKSLYAQYKILAKNLEYHLLANHLLEDGFSLLFGAFYFNDNDMFTKANHIIENELEEQILHDGGHFELSPMYHQIILDRLLDCINLLKNNKRFPDQNKLLELMEEKAKKMLSWLNIITFSNGEIPLLNDSAPGIAPTTQQLNEYVLSLNLNVPKTKLTLSESGYRKFAGKCYECVIDVGQIGPSYQPGHAHADTLSFVLNVDNKPFIVDAGVSTYEKSETRLKERGTAAHNTVTVNDTDSSEVWSSFRVARRANVTIIEDSKDRVIAQHEGYRKFKTIHTRKWEFFEEKIVITDVLTGKINKGKAHLWFTPQLIPQKNNNIINFNTNVEIIIENAEMIHVIPTKIPNGYNQFEENYKIEISFADTLKTIIKIN